jgi:enediyne polyketide synthase
LRVPGEANIGAVPAIAIVGAALRFPGATDPASFHELTLTGRRMFRELPGTTVGAGERPQGRDANEAAGRAVLRAALLDDRGRDDVTPSVPWPGDGGGVPRYGTGAVDGATGRHLLAAETARAALGDVPADGRRAAGARLGVFIADIPQPGTADMRRWVGRQLRFGERVTGAAEPTARHGAPAGHHRAGNPFDDRVVAVPDVAEPGRDAPTLNGAATANAVLPAGLHCSLRAVTEACEALNSGEFDLVLAGGVAKGIDGWMTAPLRALASENIRVYDASPTGTLPGEGCGVVALVRAADARALGLAVYAEIAGWHAAGPATPQRAVLPAAYLRAGIDPADVQFIEGHGAATATDDLDELASLAEVIGHRPDAARRRCVLGSVSANIGDTRAAAGVAALLKTAFAMTADTIPPSTGCVQPNRLLQSGSVPFRLPAAPEPWPQTPVLLAAVNTLGTSPYPDAPRSGPVHLILRRERDATHRPGRRRKPPQLPPA